VLRSIFGTFRAAEDSYLKAPASITVWVVLDELRLNFLKNF
jgi:hypothetical protein